MSSTSTEDTPPSSNLLSLNNPDFYSVELQVLEQLKTRLGQNSIADVCRDLCIDQYDFKDRWSGLLRTNDPGGLLEKIAKVRKHMGQKSVSEMAAELGYTHSTVRAIVLKLKVRPEDAHSRTKVNLAHRLMPNCGGSLQMARAQLEGRQSTHRAKRQRSSDSDSSEASDTSDEEFCTRTSRPKAAKTSHAKPHQVKVEKVSGVQSDSPAPRPVKREPTTAEQLLDMVNDLDPRLLEELQDYIPARLQLLVLFDLSESTDLKQACDRRKVDFAVMSRLWQTVLSCPKSQLEALIYCLFVLRRLGYGTSVLSEFLGQPEAIIRTCIRNLWLDLDPRHGFSFDVATCMVRQEPLTITRMAELCNVPINIARLLIRRAGQGKAVLTAMQEVLDEKRAGERVVWLFERGLSLGVICAALDLKERVVAQAWPNEQSS